MDRAAVARSYYESIDAGAYDRLRSLLADEFVHDRPDRTIEGADAFVRFMRESRPRTDTRHVVEAVYPADDRVAVEGRLEGADGDPLFRFVDTFAFVDGRIERLRTYTH
ncbi:nuclear transport factor 2 family protein [Halorarius litoreus]|uniref:nuclear transport factor 2 family protein n=1 Tax=Halorarius litoreus TaxID=2962676 RepID=UPI0020CE5039|nr:nuclear transport factor 2 family protein [Halorarius litoreus]